MSRWRRWLRRERGSALVETSLSAIVLILLVVAIFEFGMIFSTYSAVLTASRAGATYASMHPNPTDPEYGRYEEIVRNEMRAAHLDMTCVTVLLTDTPEGTSAGSPIGVTVQYRLHTFSSGIAMPVFGRLGMPTSYTIAWQTVVPIR
ncbi:MAG: TadE family protein [Anaerolineae bacterium]